MASQSWVLTDVDYEIAEDSIHLTSQDLPSASGAWQIKKSVLSGGLSDGVELVEIDNGRMRILVLPTRGMGIWKVELGDDTLGWKSPVRGPVHPKYVPLFDPSGLGWLEGFDELLVRCGLESNGAPDFDEQGKLLYPLHGRIGNRPAHFVDVTVDDAGGTITLRGIVEESRFHFQKLRLESTITTSFDSTSLKINDQVVNFGGTPAEMQMLYHLNLGEPLLQPGDQLVASVKSLRNRDEPDAEQHDGWNQYTSPVAGQAETCHYLELHADSNGHSEVLLKNAAGTSGISLNYDAKHPALLFVVEKHGRERGTVMSRDWNPRPTIPTRGPRKPSTVRVVKLTPGESWSTELQLNAALTSEEVQQAESRIAQHDQ